LAKKMALNLEEGLEMRLEGGLEMCLDLKRGNWSVSVEANQRERCWGHDLMEDLLAHC
jgi:hypothetical protein